jgi:hypothetical protein
MPSSDLIEFHALSLALAVIIQAKAKGEDESETELVSYPRTHKEYKAQPFANMTRQSIYTMVDKRMEGGYVYRIDRLEQTAESHGVRITQLEANRQPPKID